MPRHVEEFGRQTGVGNDRAQCLQYRARPYRHLRLGLEEVTRRNGGQRLGPMLETVGVVDAMFLLDGQLVVEKVKGLLDAVAAEQTTEDGGTLKGDDGGGKVGPAHLDGALGQLVLVETKGGDGKPGQKIALEAISERLVGPLDQEGSDCLNVVYGLCVACTLDGLDYIIGSGGGGEAAHVVGMQLVPAAFLDVGQILRREGRGIVEVVEAAAGGSRCG